MELSNLLHMFLIFLLAGTVCVILFSRLGLGPIVGFIMAGLIVGPNTPGIVAYTQVQHLQNITEFGVVLFLFTVGLKMQPKQLWSLRRQLFGLGWCQVLVTGMVLSCFLALVMGLSWQTAFILGLGLAQSSSAVVMTLLENQGESTTVHGKTIFAILMAQDMSIVPVMALIPILSHRTVQAVQQPVWLHGCVVFLTIAGIITVGRFVLPSIMGWISRYRSEEAFGFLLFFCVIFAAWISDLVGVSMTLGAFLLGIALSDSDYRFKAESIIEPFKGILMAFFFIAVGMSMDVMMLVNEWRTVLFVVVAVVAVKIIMLLILCRVFGSDWQSSLRSAFYLAQVGEFAFVLFGAAALAGLGSHKGVAIGYLVISITMIATPLLAGLGDRLARRVMRDQPATETLPGPAMSKHLVIVGLGEVGYAIAILAELADVPYIAVERDYNLVRRAKASGREIIYGDILSMFLQKSVCLSEASAVFISCADSERLRTLALSLRHLYPHVAIYASVETIKDRDFLRLQGIMHAGTAYVESTLFRGQELLKNLGVSDDRIKQAVERLRMDDYKILHAAYFSE
jgi:glutathione-regulated potassium-efflux system protein KefB